MSLLKTRNRFHAIQSLHSILSAMQVVTTVRLQRARTKYARQEVFLRPLRQVLAGRIAGRELTRKRLIVMNSTRGLCGRFNADLLQATAKYAAVNPGLEIMMLSPRGLENFRPGRAVVMAGAEAAQQKLDFPLAVELFRHYFDDQAELAVAYNAYRGVMNIEPLIYRLFPLPEELAAKREADEMILEPAPDQLIAAMFSAYLEARFFQLLVNSQLSEQTSRLMVLNNSVDNSRDLIEGLQLSLNKMRQAAITRELAEVVASTETLRRDLDEQG